MPSHIGVTRFDMEWIQIERKIPARSGSNTAWYYQLPGLPQPFPQPAPQLLPAAGKRRPASHPLSRLAPNAANLMHKASTRSSWVLGGLGLARALITLDIYGTIIPRRGLRRSTPMYGLHKAKTPHSRGVNSGR
jgi:hypothetical protein